jgi:hypothetical protein
MFFLLSDSTIQIGAFISNLGNTNKSWFIASIGSSGSGSLKIIGWFIPNLFCRFSKIFALAFTLISKLIGRLSPKTKFSFQCFNLYFTIEVMASTENNINNKVKHTEKMIKNLFKATINFPI